MKYKLLLLIGVLASASAFAAAPSQESIEKLLVVTEVEKLLASVHEQIDGAMKNGMAQALNRRPLPPEAKQFADSFQKKISAQMKSELSWEKMRDLYIRVYTETFTQEEIDGLITFYTSPAGRAFVVKMPAVLQRTMALMQERMGPMLQNMERSMQETIREIEAMGPQKN